jgi:LysR family glycine cleavage system transcriptional activator
MNSTRFPSIKSLRAFEAVVQLGSIKAAAEAMNVTPSAMSRRIQALEEEIGRPLFIRDVQGLRLTEAGAHYADQLRSIFKSLEQATTAVRDGARRKLTVLAPALITNPCMLQVHTLESYLPDVDINFQTAAVSLESDPALAGADIVVLWGKGGWQEWKTVCITDHTHLVPLCAPALLADASTEHERLALHTWIVAATFEEGWRLWYQALGKHMPTPKRVIKVANGLMAIDIALRGGGILMGAGFGRQPNYHVLTGGLALAHSFHAFAPDYGLYLGVRCGVDNPDIPRFTKWFFDEVWNEAAMLRWVKTRE